MAVIPLRNLLSLVQKRLIATSAALSPQPPLPPSSVLYLMKSCGLSFESAVAISLKSQSDEKKARKQALVINCLKSYGFNDTQIVKLAEKRPTILQCNIRRTLKPKLEFLVESGLTGKHLAKLIVTNPTVLSKSLDFYLKPMMEFLRQYLKTHDAIVIALHRASRLLSYDLNGFLQPNIQFLIDHGVSPDGISKLLVVQPMAVLHRPERIVYLARTVKEEMGLLPKSSNFIDGFRVLSSMSDATRKKKIKLFKSFGWSEDDIFRTFRKQPNFIAYSEEKVRSQMDFLLNIVKVEPKIIVSYPKILSFSIDKRLRPRYEVLKVLLSKKLIRGDTKILWLLTTSEKLFLQRYVTRHLDKVPGLLDMYNGSVNQSRNPRPGKIDD
ncbi:hypothetical protein SLE2022_060120 [Rubroshorea leprosula]